MANSFLDILVKKLLTFNKQLITVTSTDAFLLREDVVSYLKTQRIEVLSGNELDLRVFFELKIRNKARDVEKVLFLIKSEDIILEDISSHVDSLQFSLNTFFSDFSRSVVKKCSLSELDFLYKSKNRKSKNKEETVRYLAENFYEFKTETVQSKESRIAEWVKLYSKDVSPSEIIKEFLLSISSDLFDRETLSSKHLFFEKLRSLKAQPDTDTVDFTHSDLSIYSFESLQEPKQKSTILPTSDTSIHYTKHQEFDAESLVFRLRKISERETINWSEAIKEISEIVLLSLKNKCHDILRPETDRLNVIFQDYFLKNHHQLGSKSSYNSPGIVSNVQKHFATRYKKSSDKIALIVIDGMAYWQYNILKTHFSEKLNVEENTIHAWAPSITQLSRQALFLGNAPQRDYVQNPRNEKKLWLDFWTNKNIHKSQIRYDYENIERTNLNNIYRLAFVDIELDDKMHSSTDYNDLYQLTMNWIKRTEIATEIEYLANSGFTVFLTTDHGNVEATGGRALNHKETFGTSKSRSKRHLIYATEKLADEFIVSYPEIKDNVHQDKEKIYLRDSSSFSNKKTEVTHGGSHFMEILIPFVKITQ